MLWKKDVSVLIHGQLHFWCTLRLKTCGVHDGTLLVSEGLNVCFMDGAMAPCIVSNDGCILVRGSQR